MRNLLSKSSHSAKDPDRRPAFSFDMWINALAPEKDASLAKESRDHAKARHLLQRHASARMLPRANLQL